MFSIPAILIVLISASLGVILVKTNVTLKTAWTIFVVGIVLILLGSFLMMPFLFNMFGVGGMMRSFNNYNNDYYQRGYPYMMQGTWGTQGLNKFIQPNVDLKLIPGDVQDDTSKQ